MFARPYGSQRRHGRRSWDDRSWHGDEPGAWDEDERDARREERGALGRGHGWSRYARDPYDDELAHDERGQSWRDDEPRRFGGYADEPAYGAGAAGYRAAPRRWAGQFEPEPSLAGDGAAWHGARRRALDYGMRSSYAVGPHSGRGPKGYRRSRERILDDVCELLTVHPAVDASEVEVDVRDDVVVLRGHVHDREQKRLAEDAAESVSGVRDVRNELDVEKGLLETLADAITGRDEDDEPRAVTRRAAPRRARTTKS